MKKQASSVQYFINRFFRFLFTPKVLIPVLLIFLLASLIANGIFIYQSLERMRVVSVPDGDSLQLKDGRRVRLLGLDAPERGRCMAAEARDKLVELAMGKRVRLENLVTDDYGRTLANVIVQDWKLPGTRPGPASPAGRLEAGLVQYALLSAGLARNRSSVGNPYNQVLKEAERLAKTSKLGIWSDTCRSQIPVSEDCTIKGNTRAGEKYYYVLSCSQYSQVLVDRAYGDAWFCSEEEARKAGFDPAPACGK